MIARTDLGSIDSTDPEEQCIAEEIPHASSSGGR
jgi:hypothetical protein